MKQRTKPFDFQLKALEKIEDFDGRALVAMEMRLGKSLVSLMYAARHKAMRPIVVVCPASIKWNWEFEAIKHFGLRCEILEGMTPDAHERMWTPDTVWIINYDILGPWLPFLRGLGPQLVVIDESQMLRSRKTQRTKNVRKLCKGVPHVLALSGTPLVNRPAELFPTLNVLRPDKFVNFFAFASDYCNLRRTPWGLDYSGAKNLPELHRLLLDTCMIRTRKLEVLKDLPPKTRQVVTLSLSDPGEYADAAKDFRKWIIKRKPTKANKALRAEQISKLSHLKQLAARLKMPAQLDWIDQFLEDSDDDKIILGAVHHRVVNELEKRYRKRCVVVTGKVTGRKRQAAFEEFTKSKAKRIFIGNIIAAGTGWDGKAASTVGFVEFPWSPGELAQFEDRPWGIGQRKHVMCYYFVAHGTIEVPLVELLQRKQRVLSQTLDGGKVEGDLDIYDQLTKILRGQKA